MTYIYIIFRPMNNILIGLYLKGQF